MRTTNSILFLGTWENIYNENFNSIEFDGFKNQSGMNSFVMTPKKWIEHTNEKLIEDGLSQSERLVKLNNSAKRQMEIIKNNKNVKELQLLEKQINKNGLMIE